MIIKRNFHPLRVASYVKNDMLWAIGASAFVYVLHLWCNLQAGLPFAVAAILGSALAIFIAFRNNTSYSRWWEARTQWGGIVNASRVFVRLIITFTDSHAHQSGYDPERSQQFKQTMGRATIAWAHALRLHLRKQNEWESLAGLLNEEDWMRLMQAQNKPNVLHMIMGQHIYKAMSNGTLGGFDSFQLEGQLLALANCQGACERIKNTPLLRQYDYFTRVFLYAFIAILPFALLGDFVKMQTAWMILPTTWVIAFVFSIIGKVGEVNEDPFENKITDVPLTALCNTIERDILEMLGGKNVPEKLEPKEGFLF